jgi:hypothetical protein
VTVTLCYNDGMKASIEQTAPAKHRLIPFGVTDAKGREIGVSISITPVTVTESPEGARSYYTCFNEAGEYISVRVSATRNGKEFGSYQSPKFFKTESDANVEVERRVKSARARYEKQFA